MRLATRRSSKTVHGLTPALRPRLPSRESNVPLKSAGQTSCSTRLGEYFEGTAGNERPQLAFANVLGRPVREDNCKLSPLPVMMLNGLPEANSIRGAKVQSLKILPAKSLPRLPV